MASYETPEPSEVRIFVNNVCRVKDARFRRRFLPQIFHDQTISPAATFLLDQLNKPSAFLLIDRDEKDPDTLSLWYKKKRGVFYPAIVLSRHQITPMPAIAATLFVVSASCYLGYDGEPIQVMNHRLGYGIHIPSINVGNETLVRNYTLTLCRLAVEFGVIGLNDF